MLNIDAIKCSEKLCMKILKIEIISSLLLIIYSKILFQN